MGTRTSRSNGSHGVEEFAAQLNPEQASALRERLRPRRLLVGLDAVSACLCLLSIELLLQLRPPQSDSMRLNYFVSALIAVVITLSLVYRDGQYSQSRRMSRLSDIGGLVRNLVIAAAVSALLGYLSKGFFTGHTNPSRLVTVADLLVFVVLTVSSRLAVSAYQRRMFAKGVGLRKLLVLGTGEAAEHFMALVGSRPWLGVSCVGRLAYSSLPETANGEPIARSVEAVCISETMQGLEDLDRVLSLSGAREVVVALDEEERTLVPHVARLLSLAHVPYQVVPSLFEYSFHATVLDRYGELPVIEIEVDPLDRVQRACKRAADVTVSLLALGLFLPLLLVIAAAIVLDGGRPILYGQERIGKNGRRFHMLKYRTMVRNADQLLESLAEGNETGSELMFKIREDPRVTRVGRILRRYSLDEWPQFANVLRGEMSIVGPRPPLPGEVSKYEERHYGRLRCLPGITGLWQVSGRSNLTFDDMVRLDRHYSDNWSLGLDLKIAAKTFGAVLRRRGAY